jgi:hypothetical protein
MPNPMDILGSVMKNQPRPAQPNASMMQLQLQQRLVSDPTFANVIGPKGVDPSEMNELQFSRYQAILRELGLGPSLDIGLQ